MRWLYLNLGKATLGMLTIGALLLVFGCDPLGIAKANDIPSVPEAPVQLCPDGVTVLIPGVPCPMDEPEPEPEPPPLLAITAAFTQTQVTGTFAVQFLNESENSTRWLWTFGDGRADTTEEDPVHTFPAAGDYQVTLEAFEDNTQDSRSDRTTRIVTVI